MFIRSAGIGLQLLIFVIIFIFYNNSCFHSFHTKFIQEHRYKEELTRKGTTVCFRSSIHFCFDSHVFLRISSLCGSHHESNQCFIVIQRQSARINTNTHTVLIYWHQNFIPIDYLYHDLHFCLTHCSLLSHACAYKCIINNLIPSSL